MAVRLETMPRSGILPGLQRAMDVYQRPRPSVTLSILGRSCSEACAEFSSFISSLQPRRNLNGHATPSLVNSDRSAPSTPGNWSPLLVPHELSPITPPPETSRKMDVLMQDEPNTVIQEEELAVSDIALQEAVAMEAPISTPRTLPQVLVALLPPLTRPLTSAQQILDTVMDSQRPPTPLESPESIPDIEVVEPSRDEDYEDMTGPAPTLPSDDSTSSLSPQRGRKKSPKEKGQFRCPECPDTAPRTFTRNFDMERHIKHKHREKTPKNQRELTCPCCYEVLSRKDAFRRHYLRVPESCVRYAKLMNKSVPPRQSESLYKLCRAGHPPAPDMSILES